MTIASRYVLEHKLGAGGMGQVWAARHATTERPIAVKLILPDTTGAKVAKDRFLREARASARIGHPNVIDVFDAGELSDGTLYLAMELLDGVSLGDALRASPPMALRDFLMAMADACRGLGAAHLVEIIHRDIKPDNIFLHRERGSQVLRPVVLDFGISKFLNNPDSATMAGSLLGSPRFMSPEQVRGVEGADARADMWSIGVILFRALTGRWSHFGKSMTQLCVAIGSLPPANIDKLAPYLPPELRSLVKGCLSPLDQRLSDATLLGDHLEAVAASPAINGLTVSPDLSKPDSGITGDSLRVRDPSLTTTNTRPSARGSLPSMSGPYSSAPPSGPHSSGPPLQQSDAFILSESLEAIPEVTLDSVTGRAAESSSMMTPAPMATQSSSQGKHKLTFALVGIVALTLLIGGAGAVLLSGNEARETEATPASGEGAAAPSDEAAASEGIEGPTDEEAREEEAFADDGEQAADDEETAGDEAPTDEETAQDDPPTPPPVRPAPRQVVAPPKPKPVAKPTPEPPPTPKPKATPKPPPKPGVIGEDLGSGL